MAKRASASIVRAKLDQLRKETGWGKSELTDLLKGGGSSAKGSTFERDLCRKFSRWWTHGERDDVFWRSSGSGARAKVRGRAGASTYGQHGDMAATDPIGAPFIDIFTVELKRGYNKATVADIIDMPAKAGQQQFEGFIEQTMESAEQAGSLGWLMITRRDRREALAWMPYFMLTELRGLGAFPNGLPHPLVRIRVVVRDCNKRPHAVDMCGMHLDDWLGGIDPNQIKELQ